MQRFKLKYDEANELFEDLKNRRKLESLITMLDSFKNIKELRKYYYGG